MISHSNSFENGSAYGVKLYPPIIHKYCTMHGTWLYQMNLRLIHLERGPSDFPRGFFQVQWDQDRISGHLMPIYDPHALTYPTFSWFSNKTIGFLPFLAWWCDLKWDLPNLMHSYLISTYFLVPGHGSTKISSLTLKRHVPTFRHLN